MATQEKLFDALRSVAKKTLQAAGPRYSPALDPDAPNLQIESLQRVVGALCLGSQYRDRAREVAAELTSTQKRHSHFLKTLFRRRTVHLERVVDELEALALQTSAVPARVQLLEIRRHLRTIEKVIGDAEADAQDLVRVSEPPTNASDDERNRIAGIRTKARERLSDLSQIMAALWSAADFVRGDEGVVIGETSSILLRGAWGTGKTHFLCDYALQALSDGVPSVVVLADTLRADMTPLDAIADVTGLASDGEELLRTLDAAASANSRRALILIDAINEADRVSWRGWLPGLVSAVRDWSNVALVVSCRTPFDEIVTTPPVARRLKILDHPGFSSHEFDAQLEYFTYYKLPAMHVPLLTPEFSRPLFLKLMCEGLTRLGRRAQRKQLRDVASGQKGMTFVLENFIKHVGAEVEGRFALPAKTCWFLIKGRPNQGHVGLAGLLAQNRREWLYLDEVVGEVQLVGGLTDTQANRVVKDMIHCGLLVEYVRYRDGSYVDVLALPYQRFSDHIVARHLLDEHLVTVNAATIRRSFYANRRLGAVFVPDRWGQAFAEPGIASALMIEFPERIKRLRGSEHVSEELLDYLPRTRRLLDPFLDTFVEGLYWRSPTCVTPSTEDLVERVFRVNDQDIRHRLYEVFVGLAARTQHPWSARWLWARMCDTPMPERDLDWSEFVRYTHGESNIERLLAWVARPQTAASLDRESRANLIRLVAMLLTTTDNSIRDRATRALVTLGDSDPASLFEVALDSLSFNDPYVAERTLAASYGVCMRQWASATPDTVETIRKMAKSVIEMILRPGAIHTTCHSQTRGYAIGIVQVLLLLRPRAISKSDRALLTPVPSHLSSPFRAAGKRSRDQIENAEHAVGMDFGNYSIGAMIPERSNYDFNHPVYSEVRAQIADRIGQLGFNFELFKEIDRRIAHANERGQPAHKVDRYGKKYSWIAYFEMYGLRSAAGELRETSLTYPRSPESDIDPSFPGEPPQWQPPLPDPFAASPKAITQWLPNGQDPTYEKLVALSDVDGVSGDWVLLDARIHDRAPGAKDYREIIGNVTSTFVPIRSLSAMRAEFAKGRNGQEADMGEFGADFYTYHGEIPWSPAFGSDVRNTKGLPRLGNDRVFHYFENGWREGIRVEDPCRRWSWENHHSGTNQVGSVVVPAPPIAHFHDLRVAGGSSDLIDSRGRPATIFRRTPESAYGSYFLYMRRDLVESYAEFRKARLVHAIWGERSIGYDAYEGRLPPPTLRKILVSGDQKFDTVLGLD